MPQVKCYDDVPTFGDYRDNMSNDPLFTVLGLFLASIGLAAVYSYFQNKKDEDSDDTKAIEAHFLGGRSFGVAILFLSTFSTQYSGYTVAGVPKEASGLGWFSLRWTTGMTCAMMMMPLICPRVRRIAIARNWMSPNDIFNDRYNSACLTRIAAVASAVGTLLYMVVQFFSLAQIVDTSFLGSVCGSTVARCLAAYIWLAEFLGGLRSVAFTDSIQSAIMLFCFLCWPFKIFADSGGFAGVSGPNCQNAVYPEVNSTACALDIASGCDRPPLDCVGLGCSGAGGSGCIAYTAPWLELYPTVTTAGDICNSESAPESWHGERSGCGAGWHDKHIYFNYVTLDMLAFSLPWVSVQLMPQLIQRLMSAKSDRAIQVSQYMLIPSFIPAFLGSTLVGITAKALYPGEMTNGETAFSVMSNHLRAEGGFPAFLGVLLVASAIAAIMSTADSVAISASSIVTLDVVKPIVNGAMGFKCSDKVFIFCSKMISATLLFASCEIALSDRIYWDPLAYSDIVTWQGALGAPFAIIQIFSITLPDRWVSGWAALATIMVIYTYVLTWELYPEVTDPNSPYFTGGKPGVGNQPPTAIQFSSMYSLLSSLVFYPIFTYIFKNFLPSLAEDADPAKMHWLRKFDTLPAAQRKGWDEESTCAKINDESMKQIMGEEEPIAKKTFGIPNAYIMVGQYVMWFLALPWWETPESIAAVDPGSGIPRWALAIILITCLNIAITLHLMSQWDTDRVASNKVAAINTEGGAWAANSDKPKSQNAK